MTQSMTPLADWLSQACESRSLSWAEASRRAGLHQGAISAIVRGRALSQPDWRMRPTQGSPA